MPWARPPAGARNATPRTDSPLGRQPTVCCEGARVDDLDREDVPRQQLARGDDGEYLVGVELQLGRPDSRDAGQVGPVPRLPRRDVGERPVVEHDVGGDAVALSPLATPLLEPVE